MKKTIFGMALLAMATMNVNAQDQRQRPSDEEMAARRAEMVQKQAEKLAKDLGLADEAQTQFIATYTEYQEALAQTREEAQSQKENAREQRSEKKNKELTDEEATQRIEEMFSRQEAQLAQGAASLEVTKKYYEKFKETLTPQQLVKVFAQPQRGGRGGQQGGQQGGPRGGGEGGPRGGMGGGDFGGGEF